MELSKKELEESRSRCWCKGRKQKTASDAKKENKSMYTQVPKSINDEKHRARNVAKNMSMLRNRGEENDSGRVTQLASEKNKTRCPRCHAIIGQIQCLLQYVPVEFTERTEITDLCFCAKAQTCSCTQSAELVKIFIAATEAALYHDKLKFQHYLDLWHKEKNFLLQLLSMNKDQVKHAFDRGSVSVSVNDLRDDLEVRHILQGNNKASANKNRLNINTTNSQCDYNVLNTSKLDPVHHADTVRLVKPDSKQNVLRLQRGSQNKAHNLSKNVYDEKTYKPKSFTGNLTSKSPEVNQNDIRHIRNEESPTSELTKPVQSVSQPFSLKINNQVTNKKSKKSPQEKTKNNFSVLKNKLEKYIKGRLHKSDREDKTEINYLKLNKWNKNNTKLETNIGEQKQDQHKCITQNFTLELNRNGINSNAKHFDKTISDNVKENTKVKNIIPMKSVMNDRHQILKSEDLKNSKTNILKVTKTTIHYDEDIEENVKIIKGQSVDNKRRGFFYTETKEPKTINKYDSSKANEKKVLHTNDVTVSTYTEKAYFDRAKNSQAKILKDLISNTWPSKINEEQYKPGPQNIAHLNNHAQKRNLQKEHSVKDYMEEKVNEALTKDSKDIKYNQEYKQQQRNIQKAGGDANQLRAYQTREKTTGPKQLLTNDLQTVDHLRGGGPRKLTERFKPISFKTNLIENETKQTKHINIFKDSNKKVQENKSYFGQQQINDHLQILKDILSDVSVHHENNRRWLQVCKIKTLPIVSAHESHRYKIPGCVICKNSELSLTIEAFKNPPVFEAEPYAFIKNNKIFASITKPRKFNILHGGGGKKNKPLLFRRSYACNEELELTEDTEYDNSDLQYNTDGTIQYALSDREFIDKGWTVLPVEKIMRKLYLYRMHPVHTEFNWFGPNNFNGYLSYATGEKLADFVEKGHGRWYYKSGQVALDYYESEEMNQQRIIIYSYDGDVDQSGRSYPLTVLAIFDYSGNGIVFDHNGKIRLKYNQSEGLVLDRSIGPISHWKWHSLNSRPHLEKVVINTTLEPIEEKIVRLANQDIHKVPKPKQNKMIEIELANAVKEQQKQGKQTMQQYQIRTKVLKLNKQFSLIILDQERIHIILRDGLTHVKLNIGMVLDNSEVISVLNEDVGEIINSVEKEPAETKSLEKLQSYIEAARHTEKMRVARQRLL